MATFNYNIKNQSYEVALKNTKEALQKGDVESGVYYLDRAIELSAELATHCIIPELQKSLAAEHKKLKKIRENLVEKGINPFLPQAQTVPSASVRYFSKESG